MPTRAAAAARSAGVAVGVAADAEDAYAVVVALSQQRPLKKPATRSAARSAGVE